MEIYKIIILAIEQGITELLPISSSAHLILTGELFSIQTGTYLLSILHLGTTIAIIAYFIPTFVKKIFHKNSLSFYAKIAVATVPAAVFGLLFESTIENILRGNIYIATSLILWGIIMIVVEKREKDVQEKSITEVSWKQSIIMGVSQVIALVPGTSRSGVTTIAGVLSGVNKYTALQYSFILGIPILLGTSAYSLLKYAPVEGFNYTHIIAIAVSALFGYIVLKLLDKVKKRNWLTFFGYYRILLGLIIVVFLIP